MHLLSWSGAWRFVEVYVSAFVTFKSKLCICSVAAFFDFVLSLKSLIYILGHNSNTWYSANIVQLAIPWVILFAWLCFSWFYTTVTFQIGEPHNLIHTLLALKKYVCFQCAFKSLLCLFCFLLDLSWYFCSQWKSCFIKKRCF